MKGFPDDKVQEAARALRAVAHELRLAVLCHLSEGPLTVSQLLELTGAAQSNLSQHLAKMRLMGLLTCRRRGQEMVYQLADPAYERIVEALKAIYCPAPTETGMTEGCPVSSGEDIETSKEGDTHEH